jgi:hypothetical protein
MTQQASNKATLTTPVDLAKYQVATTRNVLKEMNDKADHAIDDQAPLQTHSVINCLLIIKRQTKLRTVSGIMSI